MKFDNLKMIPDILCFGFCTLLEWLFFKMKLGVNFFSLSLFSKNESEMKKLRDRDREVKFLENFREFKQDQIVLERSAR